MISAVRDAARASRHDDARSVGHRQDVHHPPADASDDRLRHAAQGDADEPQGDHGAADVRPARRRHQRLDRRHLLGALETHAQDQERPVSVISILPIRGRHQTYYINIII